MRLAVEAGLSFVGGEYARELYLTESALDPAAGAGTLLEQFPPADALKFGIELSPLLAERCEQHALTICADALETEWPACRVIIANPPFLLMRKFCDRIIDHIHKHDGVAWVLMPTQWLQAGGQADMQCPSLGLMSWRPAFIPKGYTGSGPRQTYAWATFLPVWADLPSVGILQKPKVSAAAVEAHVEVFRLLA